MSEKDAGHKNRLTIDSVREFLLRYDGKVRQEDLVKYFRNELTNPSSKERMRQEFKHILQKITAVKFENGEKFIVLNHQHSDNTSLARLSKKCKKADLHRNDNTQVELLRTGGGYSSSGDSESNLGTSTESVSDNASSGRRSNKSDEELADDTGLNEEERVPLIEKELMLASSRGRLNEIKRLLRRYPQVLNNRDFVFGYTVLHWAVKIGRSDIIDFSIERGIDIDSKSHGGYTPLHLAAMGGKDKILVHLLELGANIHVRDHSGKKAKDIVKDAVAPNVQRMLGKTVVINPNDPPPIVLQPLTNGPSFQRARHTGSSANDDNESSPDFARRSFKSAQSFIRKKMNSPLMERAKSSIANMTSSKGKPTPTLDRKQGNTSSNER